MLTKSTPAVNVKAGPEDGLEEGEFLVYPSTFIKTPDSYGDIVAKGAFIDDLAAWKSSGNTMPGLFGHRMDDPDYFVAGAKDMGEDEHGWWVKGFFDLESPKGKQVYRLVKGRRLNQLSFAYDVVEEADVELDDGVKANELRKLKVYEFSFVPVGANQDTSVVAVKAIANHIVEDAKAGRVLSAKNEGELREAHESIGRVLSALGSTNNEEEKANDSGPSRQAPKERVEVGTYSMPIYADIPSGQPREASQEKSSVDPSALLNAIEAQISVEIAC